MSTDTLTGSAGLFGSCIAAVPTKFASPQRWAVDLPGHRDGRSQRGLFLIDLDLIKRRKHLDNLVAIAQGGCEVRLQMFPQHAINRFRVQRKRCGTQLGSEVLLILEE